MEHFHEEEYVWLRNNVHGTYLHADSDGRSISVHERRASLKAAWGVHIYQVNNVSYLLLYSAAYGRYLAATDTRAPVVQRGYRTEQRDYDQPELPAIMWQAVDNGLGNTSVLLRDTRGRHLCANGKHTGKFLGWYTGVTVDDIDYISSMMHWTVQTIPLRGPDMPQPGFAAPIPTILQKLSVKLGRERGMWRLIRFTLASAEGGYAEDVNDWAELHFEGRLVYSVRKCVHKRLDRPVNLFGFAMCVRAGRYGHLTPLVKILPHGGNGETL
ncbi:hypothetical protein TRIUR3_27743 [Triticum urartu]|uniref:Uncharacterized protein n=2 Tax=Triticum urartu TaxID=4572 RepID=M7XDN5_TRIUA|nr:hypothetical protein TRIUR3_27743 [Triticum urartu]